MTRSNATMHSISRRQSLAGLSFALGLGASGSAAAALLGAVINLLFMVVEVVMRLE